MFVLTLSMLLTPLLWHLLSLSKYPKFLNLQTSTTSIRIVILSMGKNFILKKKELKFYNYSIMRKNILDTLSHIATHIDVIYDKLRKSRFYHLQVFSLVFPRHIAGITVIFPITLFIYINFFYNNDLFSVLYTVLSLHVIINFPIRCNISFSE